MFFNEAPWAITTSMKELYLEKAKDYLELELRIRKERRPAYSMRAFARDLQVSPSSLTDVLKGRQGFSEERARAIAKILKWSPERYDYFWNLLQSEFTADAVKQKKAQKWILQKRKQAQNHLSLDSFRMISDWHHLAILTFLQMRSEGVVADEVVDGLDLSKKLIRESLQLLERLGLAKNSKRKWQATTQQSHSGDEASSDAIRIFHSQILREAQEALEKFEMTERENFSVIYSIEKKWMPQIHQEIRKSIMKVLTEYSEKSQDNSVQVLTLQMFPVEKKSTKALK